MEKRTELRARNFPTAEQEAQTARPPSRYEGPESAYGLAFTDEKFLLREELRPVRMQLELLKPEMIQNEQDIRSTIVIFGSARILAPDAATRNLEQARSLHANPDIFSLDIDGNDYYIADDILSSGMRPKIFIVEYNSSFGPELSVTIPYRDDFRNNRAYGENLYYGCSITAWKKLFTKFGYHFVSVDTNGVNGIFIDPKEFDAEFVRKIIGQDFAENFAQLREYRVDWQKQFELISDRTLVTVN